MLFDLQVSDTDTMFDPTAPGIVTIRTAGWYVFQTSLTFAANVAGQRDAALLKNGTAYAIERRMAVTDAGWTTDVACSALIDGAIGTVVQLVAGQLSGGVLSITNAQLRAVRVAGL